MTSRLSRTRPNARVRCGGKRPTPRVARRLAAENACLLRLGAAERPLRRCCRSAKSRTNAFRRRGERQNRPASAQRPDPTEHRARSVSARTAKWPRLSLPLVKSRSKASLALRTTAEPIVVGGPHGRENPTQGASVPRRRRSPTAPPCGASRTSMLQHRGKPDAARWTVQEPSSKRMPALKCLGTDELAASESCSVGDTEIQDASTPRTARTRRAGPKVVAQRECPNQDVSAWR
jgi:hypothetical protein